jgi:ribosomal protein S18 acetylase RimI-like enzyme
MNFRQAIPEDIPQIQIVRNSVKENQLSNPNLIPDDLVEEFITKRGKGFVCEIDDKIVGFSIVDFVENNVWALFLLPDFEGKRIGKKLHQLMLDEYFSKTKETIWLSTEVNSRAEIFYKKQGWKNAGFHGNEVKFEMSFEDWKS